MILIQSSYLAWFVFTSLVSYAYNFAMLNALQVEKVETGYLGVFDRAISRMLVFILLIRLTTFKGWVEK